MRTRITILSLLVICIFNSCQREFEDPNDTAVSTTPEFRARVNGSQFTATITGATISDSIISLTGKSGDGQMIVFNVADSGIHVYILDINSLANVGAYITSTAENYTSNEGTTSAESGGNLAIVSIDRLKRLISGTFNFKAFRRQDSTQKIITEGVFNNISY